LHGPPVFLAIPRCQSIANTSRVTSHVQPHTGSDSPRTARLDRFGRCVNPRTCIHNVAVLRVDRHGGNDEIPIGPALPLPVRQLRGRV
jgi:hypothetical protein